MKPSKSIVYRISDAARSAVSHTVGLPFNDILNLDSDSESKHFALTNTKVVFSKKQKKGVVGRGNPLLSRRRFLTISEVDRRLSRIH